MLYPVELGLHGGRPHSVGQLIDELTASTVRQRYPADQSSCRKMAGLARRYKSAEI
jgi:hypothetical protein